MDDSNLIGKLGEFLFCDLINNHSNFQFRCIETMEGCTFDLWITRYVHKIFNEQGICLQVKSTSKGTNQWITNRDGKLNKTKGNWLKIPWSGYQKGAIVHVVISRAIIKKYRYYIDNNIILPILTLDEHNKNKYYILPVNQGKHDKNAYCIQNYPYLLSAYKIGLESHNERFSENNSLNVDTKIPNNLIKEIHNLLSDHPRHFKQMKFTECEQICGISHKTEHFGTKVFQLWWQLHMKGIFTVCQALSGSDAVLNNCICEFKGIRQAGICCLEDKDIRNLKNGKVRLLICHRFHYDPIANKSNYIVIIPWTKFQKNKVEINSNVLNKSTLEKYEYDFTAKDFPEILSNLINKYKSDEEPSKALYNSNLGILQDIQYIRSYLGINNNIDLNITSWEEIRLIIYNNFIEQEPVINVNYKWKNIIINDEEVKFNFPSIIDSKRKASTDWQLKRGITKEYPLNPNEPCPVTLHGIDIQETDKRQKISHKSNFVELLTINPGTIDYKIDEKDLRRSSINNLPNPSEHTFHRHLGRSSQIHCLKLFRIKGHSWLYHSSVGNTDSTFFLK